VQEGVGVGATGIGEAITRSLLSYRVADRIIGGAGLGDGMQWALDEIVEDGAEVGIIALGSDGEGLGLSNRPNMPWASWIGR
jgi:isoaspartyl peptidase/L-asparaginase-like protein (Ntn-hydrolase superfamily)